MKRNIISIVISAFCIGFISVAPCCAEVRINRDLLRTRKNIIPLLS